MEVQHKFDLEERLIDFSTSIMELIGTIQPSIAGKHLSRQIVRSGTSVALNYGEAQSAESRKDFIHKMKIILKELRETSICLRLIENGALNTTSLVPIHQENKELISIFVKSISTAERNLQKNNK